jgi:hypothetical protein
MIRGIRYRRSLAIFGAAAVIAACASYRLRITLNAQIAERRLRASAQEASISRQIAEKIMYDDGRLRELRERVSRFRVTLGGEGTWDSLVRRLGNGWSAESGPMEDRGGYSVQYGTIKLLSHTVSEWPRIVEAVRDTEAMPGVGVAELEMKASGDRERRSLDLVRILVAVQTSRAGLSPGKAK